MLDVIYSFIYILIILLSMFYSKYFINKFKYNHTFLVVLYSENRKLNKFLKNNY